MDHDRLFKQLLRTFFVEFLDLFLPEVAGYLDRASVEFLDKEVFTDVASDERHEVDLLAKARFRDREAFFLIHVESQAAAQPDFARRMFRYFARLYEGHGLPVYPIALLSYAAPARPEPDRHTVEFPDRVVLDFRFPVIQLNRLSWRDYVRRPNPVAAALMTRMEIAPEDRPRVKLECLRLLVTLKLDRARQTLIRGFMDAYLRLSAAELPAYNREVEAIDPPEREAVMQLVNEWEEIGEARGEARGIGNTVLRMLARRFGPLGPSVEQRVRALSTPQLEALADALLDFPSLAAAEAWLDANPPVPAQ